MLPRSGGLPKLDLFFSSGAAVTAAGVLIQSSQTSRDNSDNSDIRIATADGDKKDVLKHVARRGNSLKSMQMLPTLPIRIFQPNDNLLIAFDTRNKVSLYTLDYLPIFV